MSPRGSMERRQLLLSLFGLCILLVSLTFFALSVNKPYMGIELSKGEQGWVVGTVDATGLAVSYGVTIGDKPVEINGQPAQIFLARYDKVGTIWGPLIKELTVINDRGQTKSVALERSSQPIESIIELATWFVVCVVFWIIGSYVFFRRPQKIAALLLYLCGLVLGLAFSANNAATRAIPMALYLEVASSLIGPWLLMHFFLVLPEERNSLRNNPRVYFIYLPAVITLVLFPLIGYADGQPVLWFRSLRLFEYGVGFVAAAGVAIYNYARATSVRTKQQMKIVLISCLAALVPILVLNLLPQAIFGQGQTVIPAGFSILFIIFMPIGMGYSIVTQKLMDIDVVIRRTVIYGLITVIMAAILSAAIFLANNFQGSIGPPQRIIMVLVLGGLTTALFGPTKKGIETLVDKYFYKDRFDYRQIIQSLNTSLNSVKDFSDISRLIVGTVVQTLNLGGGCLFVKTQSGPFEVSAAQGVLVGSGIYEKLLNLISQRSSNIEFPNSAPNVGLDLAFLIPLIAGEKEVGILGLTQKNSRQQFSSNDLFLLQGVASVAAMSIRSAMLIRDVNMRDTFVSIASHELRTPLTSILGYAELLLRRDPPEPTRRQWIKHIFDNTKKIADMIDDLLNITRIQSGKIVMRQERLKLLGIIEERLATVKESTNKHQFVVDIEPELSDILADHDKFGEVIGNLLSNAVKYSPDGGRVTLSARHDRQMHRVVVSVADEGIGIASADRDSLFTTFHRIQRPETRNIRGSGLGLYIAKEWTKAMGGDIWLESELNKGTVFYVAVPTPDSQASGSKDSSYK